MNSSSTVLFVVFMAFMCVERVWEVFFKNKKEHGRILNKWSLLVLGFIHCIVIVATILEYFLVKRQINLRVSLTGFILYLVALVGRNWSINTLGKYHSPYVEIMDDHLLIKKGPYQYLRHPYYLSVLIEFCGFPLVFNSYYSFFISLFIYMPALFILRVYPEERSMIREFGKEYMLYKKEVFGFLPLKKIW